VYDYRQKAAIANNKKWKEIHNTYQSLEWYGTCLPGQLPRQDAAKAKELAFVVVNLPGRTSLATIAHMRRILH
jgi:hypothetical protein